MTSSPAIHESSMIAFIAPEGYPRSRPPGTQLNTNDHLPVEVPPCRAHAGGSFSGHGYSSSCPEGSPDVPLPACAPSFDCVGLPHPLHNDDAATSFIITTRSTISVSNCTPRPPARLPTTALQCLRSLGLPPPPSAPPSSALPGRRGASVCTTRTSTPRTRYAPHSARAPRAASERTRDSSPRAPPVPAEHAVHVR